MRYAIAILLLAGCTAPKPAPVDFVPAISVAVGVAEATRGGVGPAPAPTPGVCDNCNGTGKVGDGTVFVPCAACGGDGKIESGPPVETPLVERVLPNKPADAGAPRRPAAPANGQLSPRGEWRWSSAQWAWVPVKQPGPAWHQNGHSATVDHLVNTHGIDRATAERMTPAQRDIAHSNAHNAATIRKSQTVRSSGSSCPGGRCPSPSVSRGLFGRRR